MIVTNHFVYIHTSRTAGTFLNKLIMEQVPGARMLRYHGQLRDLPAEFAHLPVIGFVRNPWDWYVSMFFDYRRKQQFVYQILSDRGALAFKPTIERFLRLGDGSDGSRRLLDQLSKIAPRTINPRNPGRNGLPGLRSADFTDYREDQGYFSWLFRLMYATDTAHDIRIGRFEALRDETLRLFEETGTPITGKVSAYLDKARPLNASPRPPSHIGGYSPELERLVAEKDRYLIERFDYSFTEKGKYPKTDYFNHLGTADVSRLVERVRQLPDSLWDAEDRDKPNRFARLNDTRHIIFRFLSGTENVFDYMDHPRLWNEWQDDLMPIMVQAAERLGYSDYRFPRVMLARLPAGGEVSRHSDGESSQYIHKIHVALMTNEDTIFHVGDRAQHLAAGDIVEVNNKRIHSVRNDGNEDRIHLIFECYSVDNYGKSD